LVYPNNTIAIQVPQVSTMPRSKQTLIPIDYFFYPTKKVVSKHKGLEKKANPHLIKRTKKTKKTGYKASKGAMRFAQHLKDINYNS
jgi:hypothetical protein